MLKFISVIIILLFTSSLSYANTFVHGYYRKNGTYVNPHYRSSPNSNFYDNWSTKPNVNPYTGKEGTKISPPSGNSIIRLPKPNINNQSIPYY